MSAGSTTAAAPRRSAEPAPPGGEFRDDDGAGPSAERGQQREDAHRPAAHDQAGVAGLHAGALDGMNAHREGFGERRRAVRDVVRDAVQRVRADAGELREGAGDGPATQAEGAATPAARPIAGSADVAGAAGHERLHDDTIAGRPVRDPGRDLDAWFSGRRVPASFSGRRVHDDATELVAQDVAGAGVEGLGVLDGVQVGATDAAGAHADEHFPRFWVDGNFVDAQGAIVGHDGGSHDCLLARRADRRGAGGRG